MTKKQKTITSIALIFLLLFTFRMMFTTQRLAGAVLPLGGIAREAFAPLQKGVSWLTTSLRDIGAYFNDNRVLREENKEMAKKIIRLEEEIYSLKEHELENERLLMLLEYKEAKAENYDLVMAKVIGRSHTNWYETLLLDQGSQQGILPNMVVINHDGLIGKIINVSPHTAEVLLILDRDGAVGARIFENRHTPGVVVGTSQSQYLQMIHLPHDLPVEPNQTIVTSGLSGVFPPGIRLGRVIEVLPEPGGLMKRATIKPFVDFSRLEEVLIIKQVRQTEDFIDEPGGEV